MLERTATEIAKQILSVFDESRGSPALWRIEGLGRALCQRTSAATGDIARSRVILLDAYNSPRHQGRSDDIKSAAKQLAELVMRE